MYNNAPDHYVCPFCLVVQGCENERLLTRQSDVVYRNDEITAFICSHQFAKNAGHTLIVPNAHYENIYELPVHLGHRIHDLARAVALGMKSAYACDGVTTWQSNEPAGSQTVWHYHLHVIPRFVDDNYLRNLGALEDTYALMAPEQRAAYAQKLRTHLELGSQRSLDESPRHY